MAVEIQRAQSLLAPRAGLPQSSNVSGLQSKNADNGIIDRQRVFGRSPKPSDHHLIVERETGGGFMVGIGDDAAGPFPSRLFAEAVVAEARDAIR